MKNKRSNRVANNIYTHTYLVGVGFGVKFRAVKQRFHAIAAIGARRSLCSAHELKRCVVLVSLARDAVSELALAVGANAVGTSGLLLLSERLLRLLCL